jgi:DNA-damage-inducible protein J
MSTVIINTRVEAEVRDEFVQATRALGTTPANAIKMFVRAFVDGGGFPFDVSRPYSHELKGQALKSYETLMSEIEAGTATPYATHSAIVAEATR